MFDGISGAIAWRIRRADELFRASMLLLYTEGFVAFVKQTGRFLKGERRYRRLAPLPIAPLSTAVPVIPVIDVVDDIDTLYQRWFAKSEPDSATLEWQRRHERYFTYRPLVSILTPVFNTDEFMLRAMIESVLKQTYSNWELCLVDGHSMRESVRPVLEYYARRDPRIRVQYEAENLGISGNSNIALDMARGEYIALLDHDDTLASFALYEIVHKLNENRQLDFLYSDRDMITEDGSQRYNALFKPDWSPEILYNANYLTHLCVIRTKLVRECSGFDPNTDGAQDWDIFLRVAQRTTHIVHVPGVLYHWRCHPESASSGQQAKPYSAKGQLHTVEKFLRHKQAEAKVDFDYLGMPRVVFPVNQDVSITIVLDVTDVNCQPDALARTYVSESLYGQCEILILNRSGKALSIQTIGEDTPVQVIHFAPGTTAGLAYQTAVERARGMILVFLSAGLKAQNSAMQLHELIGWARREDIGTAGGVLLSPDGRIVSTGLILEGGIEAFGAGQGLYAPTLMGHFVWYRNFSALPRACMAMSRDVVEKVGGFDAELDASSHIDLCLRMLELNLRHIYTPHAIFRYHDQPGPVWEGSVREWSQLMRRHPAFFEQTDPCFHPYLTLEQGIPALRM